MKVLLTILPVFWPKMPPLGLAYLQQYLLDKGIEADILDLNNVFYNLAGEELKKSWLISCNTFLEENIFSIIKKYFSSEFHGAIERISQYDVAGFSCFKSNLKSTLEIIKMLRTSKKNIKIILGGPEITRQFFKTKKEFEDESLGLADHFVVGEGEIILHDFICGKLNNGRVSKLVQLENLEGLTYPKFKGISLGRYPNGGAIALQFSRGCIRRCNFCSERLLYKGFRTRNIEDTISEIKYHLENNKIRNFVFFDSILNADLKKLEKLCDEIIKNFGWINWEAQIAIRSDMPESIFEKMKKSGCYNLFIGLESGCDNTLKLMNKGFNSRQAVKFFKSLNNTHLSFGISIIVGYPGETEKDFKESLDFIIKNRDLIPKIEQVNPFTYYDGTSTDEKGDYKLNRDSLKRMEIFLDEIKRHDFKYTNAFLGNLIEKNNNDASHAN